MAQTWKELVTVALRDPSGLLQTQPSTREERQAFVYICVCARVHACVCMCMCGCVWDPSRGS